jgi:hypothetical protein
MRTILGVMKMTPSTRWTRELGAIHVDAGPVLGTVTAIGAVHCGRTAVLLRLGQATSIDVDLTSVTSSRPLSESQGMKTTGIH